MIGLVADDLTGACDSASPFLRGGRVMVALWPELPAAHELAGFACVAISTGGLGPHTTEAREKVEEDPEVMVCATPT